MEATGDYWKPFYYLLEDAGFELLLVNARHVKNLLWLAQLGAPGHRPWRPSSKRPGQRTGRERSPSLPPLFPSTDHSAPAAGRAGK
jgi:hypothetical protein